ncbi:MAG: PIN/TRAM domain-containing protein [Planctomycetota bacterium]|nr:PIN/TRAM domain-containing protein [Planctomycetota bacterium]
MLLWILRGVFLLAAVGVGFAVINAPGDDAPSFTYPWMVFVAIVTISVVIIGFDAATPRKRIDVISCVYFGILIGLFLTWIVGLSIEPHMTQFQMTKYTYSVRLVVGVMFCYFCISMLVQTRDDFRFIIPYVEFSKEIKGVKPYLLDTSVVIDGRIADLVETGVFDNTLVMPRFILSELQAIADSSDKMRRSRGRRGLDILNRLRTGDAVELTIHDRETPEMAGQPVDMKLVLLAKHLSGKVVTGDYNLNKVAKIHGVAVINLNDIANSLKPVYLPGEHLDVRIVKPGEEQGQGVGYLDDGTMIVVEGGRDHVNQNVHIAVTSVLQTSAGRMIFGKYESNE